MRVNYNWWFPGWSREKPWIINNYRGIHQASLQSPVFAKQNTPTAKNPGDQLHRLKHRHYPTIIHTVLFYTSRQHYEQSPAVWEIYTIIFNSQACTIKSCACCSWFMVINSHKKYTRSRPHFKICVLEMLTWQPWYQLYLLHSTPRCWMAQQRLFASLF